MNTNTKTMHINDANMVKIAILNLYLHQLERARIELHNPLTTGFGGTYPGKTFDIILANPPFAGKVQDESILSDLLRRFGRTPSAAPARAAISVVRSRPRLLWGEGVILDVFSRYVVAASWSGRARPGAAR